MRVDQRPTKPQQPSAPKEEKGELQILQSLSGNRAVQRIVEVAAVFTAPVQSLGPTIVEAHAQAPRQLAPDPKTTVNFITARLESNLSSELLAADKGSVKADVSDANKLIAAMKQGLPELRAVMLAHQVATKRSFTAEAMALLTAAFTPTDTALAKPRDKHDGVVAAAAMTAPMMSTDSARYTDVVQGAVGNCYFAASAAAIVARDPAFPRRIIQERQSLDGNRSYSVQLSPVLLHLPQGSQTIGVDDSVWSDRNGSSIYAGNNGASWFQVLEMASAKMDGGFGPTQSGFGFEALARLTGMTARYTLITPAHDRDATFSSLKAHNDAGHAMTTGAHIWSDPAFAAKWSGRFSEQHEYAVVDVRGTNATDGVVVLYNPWGMELTVSVDEFQRNFLGFSWLDLHAPSPSLPAVETADRPKHMSNAPTPFVATIND
jgi:hypothetical protein